MIDHVDPHQHPRRRQPPRQLHIVRARAWDRRRDDCGTPRSPPRRRAPPRETRRAAARSVLFSVPTASTAVRSTRCLRVEQHDAELLDRRATRTRGSRYAAASRGVAKLQPRARRVRQRPPAQLERGDDLRRPRAADAGDPREIVAACERASPCSPPRAASSSLATLSASPRREPLPSTSATSSLSPSAAGAVTRAASRADDRRATGLSSYYSAISVAVHRARTLY